MKRIAIIASVVASAAIAAPATAAVTFYTDLNSFQAALGSPGTLENFNNAVLVPGLTITSTNGTISNNRFNDTLTTSNSVRTDFNFATAQNGFGGIFDLSPGGAGLGIEIRLVGNGGLLSQEIPNSATGQFFGFISDRAFDVVRFTGGTQGGSAETYTLDNLRFGATTAVPEPAAWAMMLLGFGSLGFAMRRRPVTTTRIRFA